MLYSFPSWLIPSIFLMAQGKGLRNWEKIATEESRKVSRAFNNRTRGTKLGSWVLPWHSGLEKSRPHGEGRHRKTKLILCTDFLLRHLSIKFHRANKLKRQQKATKKQGEAFRTLALLKRGPPKNSLSAEFSRGLPKLGKLEVYKT